MEKPMNMHRNVEQHPKALRTLPRSFAQTKRELNLQGWEQDHVDLIISRTGLVRFLQAALEDVIVDESWYLATYPDVQTAIEAGAFSDARTHYCAFGYFEGRLPSAAGFDPARYLQKNPDLEQPLGRRGKDAILDHFLRHGYQEGRDY